MGKMGYTFHGRTAFTSCMLSVAEARIREDRRAQKEDGGQHPAADGGQEWGHRLASGDGAAKGWDPEGEGSTILALASREGGGSSEGPCGVVCVGVPAGAQSAAPAGMRIP